MEYVQTAVVFLGHFHGSSGAEQTRFFAANFWVHAHRNILAVLRLRRLKIRLDRRFVLAMGDELMV